MGGTFERRERKVTTGDCPHCGYGVRLDARNRTKVHYKVRAGKVGSTHCPGVGRTAEPKVIAILMGIHGGSKHMPWD